MKPDFDILISILLVLAGANLQAQTTIRSDTTQGRWDVTFQTSSLETILLHPDKILEEPDTFWETDAAYRLVKIWHEENNISMDTREYYKGWMAFLKAQAEVPEDKRMNHPAFQLLKELQNRIPLFQEQSIQLLNDFIPQNTLTFKTTIHITGKTFPYAMMEDGEIIVDVLSNRFDNDPDKIFNSVTHECFHVGYGFNRYLRNETELVNDFIYSTMLDALQNEGIATYLGYQAQAFFPAKNTKDYQMLDNSAEVRRLLAEVNRVFTIAESVPLDSIQKMSWEVGVIQRAYYITGAHMARTIDEQLGRKALVGTIAEGPLCFVDRYNGLVRETMRVVSFGMPAQPSLLQQLRSAALDHDHAAFDKVTTEIKAEREELSPTTQLRIERIGYGMQLRGTYDWAIAIFKFEVALFPESASSYDRLAEAYLKSGDTGNAIRYYRQALKIDPGLKDAQKMLKELDRSE